MRTPITRTSADGRIVVTRYELNEYEVIVDRVVEGTCTNRADAWQLGRDTLASIVAATAAATSRYQNPENDWASRYDCPNNGAQAEAHPIAAPVAPAPIFAKRVQPSYVYDGKIRRGTSGKHLVGFDGFLDEKWVVFCSTERAVIEALDEMAYNLLRTEAVVSADEQAERDAEDEAIALDAMIEAILERDEDAAAEGEDRAAAEQERYSAYGWGI